MIFRISDSADLIKPLVEEEVFVVLQPFMESWRFALEKKSSDFCHSMQYFCCTGGV